jgi:hypothetical protein
MEVLEVRILALCCLLCMQPCLGRAQTAASGLDGGLLDASTVSRTGTAAPLSPQHDDGAPDAAIAPAAAHAELSGWVGIRGLKRTRESTVSDLLPRQPPALYSDAELLELQRRLDNLGIFDRVKIRRVPAGIEIWLREKWTLIPALDMQRGKTFEDTFLMLGGTEYNLLGTASSLSAIVSHEERGWNGELAFAQHGYHPGRGALQASLEWVNSSYRFEQPPLTSWYVRSIGGSGSWKNPLLHGRFFTYEVTTKYHYELVDEAQGGYRPPDGHELMAELNGTWDYYHWTDLEPNGWTLTLIGASGLLVAKDGAQDRLALDAELGFAWPLGRSTSLLGRVVGHVSSQGNVNFSSLLGGLEGVRGLDDALYRNWLQGYLNLELRQSLRLWERLAVQLVLLTDSAAYRQLDRFGHDSGGAGALSAGMGGRLIPTFLSEIALRVDVVRLLVPRREWFVSWGLSQYF